MSLIEHIETLHSKQFEIATSILLKKQSGILCCGRGFGKSIGARAIIAFSAATYSGPWNTKTEFFNVIAGPTFNQIKRVHWKPLKRLFTDTPLKTLVKRIDNTECVIELKGKRPSIMLAGLNDDDGDKLRGISIPTLVIDEFQDVKPNLWAAVKPSVDRARGQVLVTGTPKGRSTFFYKFKEEMITKGWRYWHYSTADNPTLPDVAEIVRQAEYELPASIFRQEFLASWEDAPGSIFDGITDANFQSVSLNPDDYEAVVMGVDWGDYNPAAIIVGLTRDIPHKYVVLDYWLPNSNTQTPIAIPFDKVKAQLLQFANQYNIQSVWPDMFQPGWMNFCHELMMLDHPGLRNIDLSAERLHVMPSCSLLNRLFKVDRLIVNKDLEEVENDLRTYHRKQAKDGSFLDEPDPSCREHLIDCLRYPIGRIETPLVIHYGNSFAEYSAA